MILIDVDRTFEIKVDDVTFTCRPIIAKDMARFMDMTATFDDKGNASVKVNQRNYEVCKEYIVSADGLKLPNGNKVVWKPELIDQLPLEVINKVAVEIIRKSAPTEEDEKN